MLLHLPPLEANDEQLFRVVWGEVPFPEFGTSLGTDFGVWTAPLAEELLATLREEVV